MLRKESEKGYVTECCDQTSLPRQEETNTAEQDVLTTQQQEETSTAPKMS